MFPLERKELKTPFGLVRGWEQRIPGCLVNSESKRGFCAPSLLDSGAPGLVAHSNNRIDLEGWTDGMVATLGFRTKAGVLVSDSFVIDRQPGAGFTAADRKIGAARGTELKMGTLPYYSFSVLYESKTGQIGLKKRAD